MRRSSQINMYMFHLYKVKIKVYLAPLIIASWAVYFCQTFISKIALWVNLIFSSSHKDMSWDEVKNSSLSLPFHQWVPVWTNARCDPVHDAARWLGRGSWPPGHGGWALSDARGRGRSSSRAEQVGLRSLAEERASLNVAARVAGCGSSPERRLHRTQPPLESRAEGSWAMIARLVAWAWTSPDTGGPARGRGHRWDAGAVVPGLQEGRGRR
jgi:hypothetical protein